MTKKFIKIIIIGNGGVGKTSLLKRYATIPNEYIFNHKEELTKGYDFYTKNIKIDGIIYQLILCDLGGQAQFKSIHNKKCEFLCEPNGALLLFDLARITSFSNLDSWLNLLESYGDFPILLVGSKLDALEESYSIYDEYVLDFLKKSRKCFGYIKISSKENININTCFMLLISRILSNNIKLSIQGSFILNHKIFEEKDSTLVTLY